MKPFPILFVLFILFSAATDREAATECFPDKGIKTAKTVAKYDGETGMEIVEFDKMGRPTRKENEEKGIKTNYVYQNGKLIYTIIENSKSGFFFEGEGVDVKETLVDTGFVVAYAKDGRPKEMGGIEDTKLLFEYTGCDKVFQTLVRENGDTLHQTEVIMEKGVLVKRIWTAHFPEKSVRTTKYYGYAFNKKGHWIKRKYQHPDQPEVSETRKLTYY